MRARVGTDASGPGTPGPAGAAAGRRTGYGAARPASASRPAGRRRRWAGAGRPTGAEPPPPPRNVGNPAVLWRGGVSPQQGTCAFSEQRVMRA